ncbi:hypothetical protein [Haloarchaeobius sp. TZWSO28]|uniref:hypothetical protein n=1 Tax=Haloarchaeobius sp. TZWSO28 TaxID=3446119 RepID=UPI003EBCD865
MTPTETLGQFVTDHGIDLEHVSIVEETNEVGDPVRYLLELDRAAPRDAIVAFYRMQAVNLVNSDGERTYVYAEYVDDLREED